MPRTIRLGRWHAELYDRAIYLTRWPHPNCPHCRGVGAVVVGHTLTGGGLADDATITCDCWDPTGIRIPLWRRSRRDIEVPF